MTIQIDTATESAATLQSLIDAAAEASPVTKTQSGVERSKEIDAAIANGDLDELMNLQFKMNKVIEKILANKIDVDNLGLMSDDKLQALALEQLDLKDIERLLEVRYQLRREAIFAHITAMLDAQGVKDPANATGKAVMAALGMKWTRTGGTLRNVMDREGMKKAMTKKQWSEVVDTVEHPATEAWTEEVFNEEKFTQLLVKNPKLMLKLSEHIIPGGRTPKTLGLKKLTAEDKKELVSDEEE